MHAPAIQTMISADVALRGPLQNMPATGSVTVPRGRVLLDELPWGGPAEVEPWELTVEGVYGAGPEAVEASGDEAGAPGLALESAFSAGRYLTQKLFLSIGRQFGDEGGLQVALEYSITPRLKLEVSSTEGADSAVDLQWQRDY